MLRRLAWSSIPSRSLSAARLNEIGARARRNNERNHVSGMLLFTGAHFLAILEGDQWDLQTLWVRLERDQRHCELIRSGDDLCGNRWFPEWTMATPIMPLSIHRSRIFDCRRPAFHRSGQK